MQIVSNPAPEENERWDLTPEGEAIANLIRATDQEIAGMLRDQRDIITGQSELIAKLRFDSTAVEVGAESVITLLSQIAVELDDNGEFNVLVDGEAINLAALWPSDPGDTGILSELLFHQSRLGTPFVRVCKGCLRPDGLCGGPCTVCSECLSGDGECEGGDDQYHVRDCEEIGEGR